VQSCSNLIKIPTICLLLVAQLGKTSNLLCALTRTKAACTKFGAFCDLTYLTWRGRCARRRSTPMRHCGFRAARPCSAVPAGSRASTTAPSSSPVRLRLCHPRHQLVTELCRSFQITVILNNPSKKQNYPARRQAFDRLRCVEGAHRMTFSPAPGEKAAHEAWVRGEYVR
jgi:hypothetical protein